MFDLKNVDVKSLRTDLVKNTTILVLARLLSFYLVENAGSTPDIMGAFDPKWVYGLVFTLLGFVFFHVVVNPTLSKME